MRTKPMSRSEKETLKRRESNAHTYTRRTHVRKSMCADTELCCNNGNDKIVSTQIERRIFINMRSSLGRRGVENSLTRSDNECGNYALYSLRSLIRFINMYYIYTCLFTLLFFVRFCSLFCRYVRVCCSTCTRCVPCPVFIFFYLLRFAVAV